jgi:hypothetical protein
VADRIRPVVHLLFACDDAVFNLELERWGLTAPWHTVTLPPEVSFPFRAEEFWVYAQLTGGLGEFELGVELRHLVDDGQPRVVGWGRVATVEFPAAERLQAADMVFSLGNMPFREPGIYEIRVLSDDEPGEWVILAGVTFEFRVLDGRTVV